MPVRLFRVTIPTRLIAIALPAEAVPALADREVSRLPLGRLTFRPGKSRTDQRTMDRPLVIGPRNDRFLDVDGFRLFRGFYCFHRKNGLDLDDVRVGFFNNFFCRHQNGRFDGRRRRRRDRLLPSWRWNLGVLVLVLGVARGAACLLHLVFNHCDDRMVGDATLARTVVV
jgi:hypothetical protein